MSTLFLLVNERCDIACTYCFYTTGHEVRSKKRIMPEQFKSLSERIAALGFKRVILTGGDPLQSSLKNETFSLIAFLREHGLQVIVNTSAVKLTEVDLARVIELGVDRVDISIDSHLPEVHDAERGRFREVDWALRRLIALGYCSVVTTTVVTRANASTLGATYEYLKGLGVKDCRFQRAFRPLEPTVPAADPALDAMRAIKGNHPLHWGQYLELTQSALAGRSVHDPRATCRMGKEYFVCSPEGKLTVCFHRNDIVLGDIHRDPIEKLQQSMRQNPLGNESDLPRCFGKHCTSLFDNPAFWKERYEHV